MIYSIIFDWKRTLYDPDTNSMLDGATDLLEYLKEKKIRLILIGKGGQDMHDAVSKLNVKGYFSDIIFQEGKKDINQFTTFVSPHNQKDTLLIGDRIKSEIVLGNKLGVTTIWVQNGKFASELPETKEEQPTYTVANLQECMDLIKKLLT